jgi:hypothetical protein
LFRVEHDLFQKFKNQKDGQDATSVRPAHAAAKQSTKVATTYTAARHGASPEAKFTVSSANAE